ncbi:hypothetical protein B484DRAFT_455096 [Ochromonadaceae sp. CCMP2298]|nr:hypothetical protein B484DRAFT_455096 [Ochromonadaceae sp. CCMP2298]
MITFWVICAICLCAAHAFAPLRPAPVPTTALRESMGDIFKSKSGLLKQIAPALLWFGLALSDIYGRGFGPFGSMTDFDLLNNRGSPTTTANEYIVAPKGFTPARADAISSVYSVPVGELSDIVDEIVLRQPRITRIAEDPATSRKEWVQRSLLFRFPDVITVQLIPLTDSSSTLAVHSYSVYGGSDLGVNGNRVRSWLSEIEAKTNRLRQ